MKEHHHHLKVTKSIKEYVKKEIKTEKFKKLQVAKDSRTKSGQMYLNTSRPYDIICPPVLEVEISG